MSRSRPAWLLCAVLFLGCDGSSLLASDAGSPDPSVPAPVPEPLPEPSRPLDPGAPPDSGAGGCDEASLRFSRSESEVTAALEALPAAALARGASHAYFDPPPSGTKQTYMHLLLDLPVAPSEDPLQAALRWLASLDGLPLRPDEYSWNPLHKQPFDGSDQAIAWFVRTSIEGVTFPAGAEGRDAVSMVIKKNGTGWRVLSLILEPSLVFASRADASAQLRCTPSAPPSEVGLRSHRFTGTELVGCAPTGVYSYALKPDDRVVWPGKVTWSIGATASTAGRWMASRTAELHLVKSNWWPEIMKADCFCDDEDHTGFTVVVDALTGAIERVTPGINCAVC